MALIKCPRCGQTVLSVASTCPKCSYLFLQEPKEESAAGELIDCRRCSKRIPPESASCPYCAYPVRRARVLARAGIGAGVAVVALVVLVVALGRRGSEEPLVASVAGQPPAQPVDPPSDGQLQPADTAGADTAFRASPVEAAPPRTAAVRSLTPERQALARDTAAARPRPGPVPPEAVGVRGTRWSLDWVNVREGRGVDNAIVTVLRPGVEVQLADQRGGWWAVYVDGTFVGYASGALFGPEPPADTTT